MSRSFNLDGFFVWIYHYLIVVYILITELYWPFEKKWYFLTPRMRMTPNGDRPNRMTRDFGYWKTTKKDSTVSDDASGLEVGKKRSLVYYDASNKKSQWLMHEYTTMNPNIPVGSIEDKMKVCSIL